MTIWDVALVLSDEGMSSRLDELLRNFVEEGNPERTALFVDWARDRAQRIDDERSHG